MEEGAHRTNSEMDCFFFLSFSFFTIFPPNSVTATIGVTLGHYAPETSVSSVKGTPSDGVDLLSWKCKFMTHFALGCRVAESNRVNPGRHICTKQSVFERGCFPLCLSDCIVMGPPTDIKGYFGLRNIRNSFSHSARGRRN